MDERAGIATESKLTYDFRAVCTAADEAHVRAPLVQSLGGSGFMMRGLSSADLESSNRVQVDALLVGPGAVTKPSSLWPDAATPPNDQVQRQIVPARHAPQLLYADLHQLNDPVVARLV